MKRTSMIIAAAIMVMACGQNVNHKCIDTLPAGYSLDSLTDCRVPAAFTVGDINWRGSNVTVEVFAENFYDSAEVSQMQKGDTLMYDGQPMVVETIENVNGTIEVNGGLEEGGAWLMPYEGGTYRAVEFDDHSVYTSLGKKELILNDNFIISDCGENPQDSTVYVCENQKLYLESLPESRQAFSKLNTKLLVENGEVTAVQRVWIP